MNLLLIYTNCFIIIAFFTVREDAQKSEIGILKNKDISYGGYYSRTTNFKYINCKQANINN
jgi:hypothetical protein